MVNEGVRALDRADGKTARAHFLRAVRRDPENANAHYHVGLACAHHTEEPELAMTHLETADRLAPGDLETLFQMGRLATVEGHGQAGLEHLGAALQLDANHGPSWYYKGIALRALERFEEADKSLREAIRIRPRNSRGFLELGDLYETFEADEEALAIYEEGMRHNPGNSDLCNALGVLAARLGEPHKAVAHFERALEIQRGRMDSLFNLGFALAEAGQRKQALRTLESYRGYADPIADASKLRIVHALTGSLLVENAGQR